MNRVRVTHYPYTYPYANVIIMLITALKNDNKCTLIAKYFPCFHRAVVGSTTRPRIGLLQCGSSFVVLTPICPMQSLLFQLQLHSS